MQYYVELETPDSESAAHFYTKVWNLAPVTSIGRSQYFRGSGPLHHILVLHRTDRKPAIRRVVFDIDSLESLRFVHERITNTTNEIEPIHKLETPGGGTGFGFRDPLGRSRRGHPQIWTDAIAAADQFHKKDHLPDESTVRMAAPFNKIIALGVDRPLRPKE
jgi:hypothetical protein